MPPEPNENIDRLLKACAQQRREQADASSFELHPATRAMLQSEAANLAPRRRKKWKHKKKRRMIFLPFLRRIALVGPALAAVILCGIIFFTPEKLKPWNTAAKTGVTVVTGAEESSQAYIGRLHSELKKSESVSDEVAPLLADDKDMLASNDRLLRKKSPEKSDGSALNGANANTDGTTVSSGTLAVTAARAPAEESEHRFDKAKDNLASREAAKPADVSGSLGSNGGTLALNSPQPSDGANFKLPQPQQTELEVPAPFAGMPASSVRRDGSVSDKLTGAEKALDTPDAKRAGAPAILVNFEVRQEGETIRLTDADGSVYTGKILRTTAQQQQQFGFAAVQSFYAKTRGITVQNGGLKFRASGVTAGLSNSGALTDSEPQWQMLPAQKISGVAAATSNGISPTAAPAVQPALQPQSQTAFTFRATGTNRSLQQPVVVEGSFLVGMQQTAGDLRAASKASAGSATLQQSQQSQTATRIRAIARIGTAQQVEIDAEAVPPIIPQDQRMKAAAPQ